MKLQLNHVSILAADAKALSDFYRNVIGLEPAVTPGAKDVSPESYKWMKVGNGVELHLMEPNEELAKNLGVEINPLNNHFAITVDSVEEIKEITDRLTKEGIKWMDWSPHGVPGKHQVFMVDPAGNLVEFLLS